jgi:hypothetical protein
MAIRHTNTGDASAITRLLTAAGIQASSKGSRVHDGVFTRVLPSKVDAACAILCRKGYAYQIVQRSVSSRSPMALINVHSKAD